MKDKKSKIEIPKGITSEEFFMRFVPETYNKNVREYDMSGYKGFTLTAQINITGTDGGEYGINMTDGVKVETTKDKIKDPVLIYTFNSKHFRDAVDGEFPWIPLDMAFDPEAFQDGFTPEQSHEEMDILDGLVGQADIRVTRGAGEVVDVRINFHGGTEPYVIFNTTQKIVEEIKEKEYTVMEAFMASKIRVDGPVEFAMHVMALAPEEEEEDGGP